MMLQEFRNETRRQLAAGVREWFFRLVILANAVATFLFFASYAQGLFAWAGSPSDAIAAGLFGAAVVDGGYIGWRLAAYQSKTSGQAVLAWTMFGVMALLSVALSATWATLYALAALTDQLPWWLTAAANGVGWISVIMPLCAHMAAVLITKLMDPEAREARQAAELNHFKSRIRLEEQARVAELEAQDLLAIQERLRANHRLQLRDNTWQELTAELQERYRPVDYDDVEVAPPPRRTNGAARHAAATGPRLPRLEDDAGK